MPKPTREEYVRAVERLLNFWETYVKQVMDHGGHDTTIDVPIEELRDLIDREYTNKE